MPAPARKRLAAAILALATIAAALAAVIGLRLEPNVASLLPDRGEAAALRRYAQAFGGADVAVVAVEGPDPAENAAAAAEIARGLAARPSVKRAADRLDLARAPDPMRAYCWADPAARERIAGALAPAGMRARLGETRAMLLAPGSGALGETIAADPLRIAQIAFEREGGVSLGTGMQSRADGAFATADGRMHLVLVQPAGQALRGADARAFVKDADEVLAAARAAHPGVTAELTGGHAIAAATEAMLTRDLTVSGALATALASIAFVLLFRRTRALVAVLPPLVIGTLWTAALAALLPGGLSAIAVAFTSVVVGVGVDTGVHVYAALLDARREGFAPADAAQRARARTARAVMTAAITAGAAFFALGLSDIGAVRQLGLLCGAGEILTAIAIVAITPEIGALLERSPPPPEAPSRWTAAVAWLTATRARAAIAALVTLAPLPALATLGPPPLAEAIVAIRPQKLAPLAVQQRIFDAFGGRAGQWVVLVTDPSLDRLHTRVDRLARRLADLPADVTAVDALTSLLPSPEARDACFADRARLLANGRAAGELEKALAETGFAPDRFSGAIAEMRDPPRDFPTLGDLEKGPAALLLGRYLRHEASPGDHVAAIYLHPGAAPGAAARIEAAVRAADPEAALTGYGRLDATLRATLAHDVPRIGLAAAALVVIALAASLRRARDVVIAALVVGAELAAVLLLVRVLRIPLHAYDALVLPVLLGITVDEGMFLLHHAREGHGDVAATLRHEGPPVAATALTTAAGFAALGSCDFDGLRHLGWVGALGSAVGLVVALVLVPAGLRLTAPRR